MLNIAPSLIDNLNKEVSTLCRCYLLTRTDGAQLGFTDHDRNIIIAGITYIASASFNPSNVSYTNNLSSDNLTLNGVLSLANINDLDILSGKYDDAKMSIFMVDWENPPTSLDAQPLQYLPLLGNARIGKIDKDNLRFIADVTGQGYYLNQKIGDLTSRTCRHNLGDARCRVNLTNYTRTYTIASITERYITVTDLVNPPVQTNHYYANGLITMTSGANIRRSLEVSGYQIGTGNPATSAIFSLYEPPFIKLNIGDTFSAVAGCNKDLSTCSEKFGNVVNFGGEPFVPGTDFYFNGTQGQ